MTQRARTREETGVHLALDLIHETADAYKVGDGDAEVWLPKSQVTIDSDGDFVMPIWLAYEHGLI
jgi:hypothetical protein